jgi:hypothetical protein
VEEREGLRALAAEEASSENFLVRIGLRVLLGLPVPRYYRERMREELERAELERSAA